MAFDAELFRKQFSALNGSLVYLDSAATALKPQAMIDATIQYYAIETTTMLRSSHQLALSNTSQAEQTRKQIADLINAPTSQTIIWTRGATESINLVAYCYGLHHLTADSEIIVSELEHHSNLIPWLNIAKQIGAKIVKWPIETDGSLSINKFKQLISSRTKIVAITQMSNVTGYQPELLQISQITHQYDAVLLVDGAQGVVHHALDVALYDIDFYVFSAHKLYGPSGLGILFAKHSLLETMSIWHGGGKMVEHVDFDNYTAAPLPYKFEAGTPNIAGIIALNATLNYLNTLDMQQAESYTQKLAGYAKQQLASIDGIKFYNVDNSPLLTFTIDNVHHSDIATLLFEQDIAIRNGELCARPLINALNCDGVLRISLMPYNNQQDIDKFVTALHNSLEILN